MTNTVFAEMRRRLEPLAPSPAFFHPPRSVLGVQVGLRLALIARSTLLMV